ncbi:MAG TPA: hypothetical protein VFD58_08750 [Blastocatellia bacterium]|nr:hypothetical protein [Blastocatellia bacterium]
MLSPLYTTFGLRAFHLSRDVGYGGGKQESTGDHRKDLWAIEELTG